MVDVTSVVFHLCDAIDYDVNHNINKTRRIILIVIGSLDIILLYHIKAVVIMPLVDNDCQASYKVLVLGDHTVGKTALLNRLMNQEFRTSMMPTCGKQRGLDLNTCIVLSVQN